MIDIEIEDDPKRLAEGRWKAITGFNGIPGLSSIARRVGIALIAIMDSRGCGSGWQGSK